jgi:nucleotide-binding universal stress UspA family protein
MHYSHILVTTDFSEDSIRAFDFAAYEGKMEDCKISLLAVINDWDVPPVFLQDIANPEAITQYRKELLEKGKTKLEEYASSLFHNQKVETHATLATDPAGKVIVDYAEKNNCDLIVMASHGRGALGNLLLGSVVQRVVKQSSCPVLVIPKKK